MSRSTRASLRSKAESPSESSVDGDGVWVHIVAWWQHRQSEIANDGESGVELRGERFLRRLYDLKYLFGDKWALAILVALADGPMRRVEILSTINSYSIGEEWSDKHAVLHDSMLARTLKKMTEEGLLVRNRHAEIFPPEVFYSLTEGAADFVRLVEPAILWADEHAELIAQAQAYSRRRGRDVGTLTGIDELNDGDVDEDDD